MSESGLENKALFQERRLHTRSDARLSAVLTMDGRNINCVVKNMSPCGLLLEIVREQPESLSQDDTGRDAAVIFESGDRPEQNLNGVIVRVLENNDIRVVAFAVVK
jgi:hypothetical protein